MGVPYAVQLADKQRTVAATLDALVPEAVWEEPASSPESGFRNRAKLVVGGTKGRPTLGILDAHGQGVDLRHCGLHEPGLHAALLVLADLLDGSGLTPYDVPRRQGELKHLLVTHSPADELMVRFVLRSPGQLPRVHALLPQLTRALPGTRVVSVNLQPEHKAVLEGAEEIVLTPQETLPMRVNDITLHLRTRSFFQTNTTVAAALYRQATRWIDDLAPASVLDLYCGVGGFALHAARADRRVLGVELAPEAVLSARASAAGMGLDPARASFVAADATSYLDVQSSAGTEQPPLPGVPDLVIVNPPRRGLGADLCEQLETGDVQHLIYSSCSADSLARDLARIPSLRPVAARLFDMFPQTGHHEVLVSLTRVR